MALVSESSLPVEAVGRGVFINLLPQGGAADAPIVIPFTANDNYNGTYPNSASVIGSYFLARWTLDSVWTSGTPSITGDSFRYVMDSASPSLLAYFPKVAQVAQPGGFTVTVKVSMISMLENITISQSGNLRIHDDLDVFIGQIFLTKQDADAVDQWQITVEDGGGAVDIVTDYPNDFIWLRVERVGTTISYFYSSDGVTYVDSLESTTSSASAYPLLLGFSRWTGGNLTMDWDDFSFLDENGDEIPMTPPA